MQQRIFVIILLLSLIPTFCLASWQIAGDPVRTPGAQPLQMANGVAQTYQVNKRYTLTAKKGLLIYTVRNYAHSHNWKLIWMVPTNIMNNVNATFTGPDFQHVLNLLLSYYPAITASYNLQTQTVTITRS
ncbi:MAG: hypothetical protein A3E87_09690 [Gammaproteobacteria bacterium RIFCSPHIGHO2_12_FULL_35_23]|nr:MAG: hypothetical protein A3E87_09690 [Gammaproteobacteria bacterium RIFCSPHIGHO2_12_FULL_35_23]